MSSLQAIRFDRTNITLQILDQLLLPYQSVYLDVTDVDDGYNSIKKMQVRGAPAIAIVGVFSIVVELHRVINLENTAFGYDLAHIDAFKAKFYERIDFLVQSRPTAVNLSNACGDVQTIVKNTNSLKEIYANIYTYAINLYDDDLANNLKLGKNGVDYMLGELAKENFTGPFSIMTICNTGALATAGHGTALGIIRSAWLESKENPQSEKNANSAWLDHVYPLETRPYNQGARLTAYELVYEQIPATLVTDNMAAYLIDSLEKGSKEGAASPIKFIIVGADRIVKNGDTANKIGTYQLSKIIESNPKIKFLVAAPKTTIDLRSATGSEIVVEQRPRIELTQLTGALVQNEQIVIVDNEPTLNTVRIAAPGIDVWNPSFDVTPHVLIDAIITEQEAVVKKDGEFDLVGLFN